MLAAVSDCLCAAFCVEAVQQLGHGSVQHLLQLSKAVPANSSKHIWSVHALVAGAASSAQCRDAGAAMFGAADPAAVREAALTCLAAAPVLADLHAWSNWDKVCGAGTVAQEPTTTRAFERCPSQPANNRCVMLN